MENELEHDFNLGEAVVRPRGRTIEVGGESRQVDHKAMQVLACLARRPGAAVSKQEIFDAVWAQSFVSDEVLTVAVSRLRRALGDQARSPRFIETVPQVGYRLIAPLTPAADAAGPEDARRRRRRLAVAAGAAGLLAAGWLAGLLGREPDRPAPPAGGISSLAVLPLLNLTGDSGQAHLAEGITEALITGLAGQGDVRVVSRAAVRRYGQERPDSAETARQLEVDALLEGSVQRSGKRLRIAARLVDASGGHHLWAETFDGELSEVLDLQHAALTAIRRQLGAGAQRRERPARRLDPAAYEAYLRGRYLLGQTAVPDRLQRAVRELEAATALAPEHTDAHLALAEAWLALGEDVLVPPRQAFAEVRAAAGRALALGDNPAAARALLAMVYFLHDWDFDAAESEFRHAIALDGDEILARDGYSRYLTVMGRFDEALAEQTRLSRSRRRCGSSIR